MREYFSNILGNKDLKSRLCKDIEDGTLSNAYILEGRSGSGRHTAALLSAMALACENKDDSDFPLPCGTCKSCKKILDGNSPDIMYVSKGDKVSMGVEQIRLIRSDIYTRPNELPAKIYIIEDADTMTVQAQNAFLLTLEEPPEYVLFFLLCENTSLLLETVRSRAPILRLDTISRDDISDYILSHDKKAEQLKKSSPDEFSEIVLLSDGSIGKALKLLDPKFRKPYLEDRELASAFITSTRHQKGSDISTVFSLGTKRPEIIERLTYIENAIRDLIVLKKNEDVDLIFYTDREKALDIAYSFPTSQLFKLYDSVENAKQELLANSNIRLTLTELCIRSGLI